MKLFTTTTALLADKPIAGQVVQTLGFSAAGDGGAGQYRILTAADFGGTPNEVTQLTLANGNIAVLQSYLATEGYSDEGAVSGSVTLDCEDGATTTFEFSTSGAITDITMANVPADVGVIFGVIIIVEIGATPDTIAFGAEFDWDGGSAPAFDTASTKEVVVAFTVDGGTSWKATLAMQGLTV